MMPPRNRKYNIVIGAMRCANKLLAYLGFRIANKLWAIRRRLIIKKIHLFHILQVLPRKAIGFGNSRFQILT